eukprot:NODE_3358_length_982_cov_22.877193_g3212_i0.p1 GENE.NODE_3358_length_982_cov_22.877193_g3212_i0~~NODE_3358_length_982_cov_22.877193_g3212_i0.p1  ORF type:complete len:310 (-),score=64.59 NODE_3358_length_982_cov_22.877193_g3212_i0:53-958(-)
MKESKVFEQLGSSFDIKPTNKLNPAKGGRRHASIQVDAADFCVSGGVLHATPELFADVMSMLKSNLSSLHLIASSTTFDPAVACPKLSALSSASLHLLNTVEGRFHTHTDHHAAQAHLFEARIQQLLLDSRAKEDTLQQLTRMVEDLRTQLQGPALATVALQEIQSPLAEPSTRVLTPQHVTTAHNQSLPQPAPADNFRELQATPADDTSHLSPTLSEQSTESTMQKLRTRHRLLQARVGPITTPHSASLSSQLIDHCEADAVVAAQRLTEQNSRAFADFVSHKRPTKRRPDHLNTGLHWK